MLPEKTLDVENSLRKVRIALSDALHMQPRNDLALELDESGRQELYRLRLLMDENPLTLVGFDIVDLGMVEEGLRQRIESEGVLL